VAEIIVEEEFRQLLQEGKPLRLKMGFDPSRPDIHLGHVVGLRKLRQLQELGHRVILIVGDWTAQIGDPSGQSATRPMLTHEEVVENAESYMRQFFRVVDRQRTEVRWQSEWFGKFTLADVIRLTSRFTVAQFLSREDFAARYQANRPIAITELLYPLLQAYDSIAIESDVEFGGTDQKFNLLVGRELQRMLGQRSQQCFLVPILVGTDGVQKMSKSLNNYIGVDDPPYDIQRNGERQKGMYGKVMRIPDERITEYLWLLTDVPDEELEEMDRSMASGSVNPMELKKRLAYDITAQFHGQEAATAAQEHFERQVQRREVPEDVPTVRFRSLGKGQGYLFYTYSGPVNVRLARRRADNALLADRVPAAETLCKLKLAPSTSEAKRLLAQGSVEADGKRVRMSIKLSDGLVIQVGKRRFVRLVEK
jgi:tyrosyl-tRNA synthetase